MKKAVFGMAISLLALLLSCGNNNGAPQGSGLIEATDVTVSSETNGRIISMYFNEGDRIETGDTIALIDTVTLSLRLQQAAATIGAARAKVEISGLNIRQSKYNLDLAQKEYDRAASLIKSGSANQQQYDQAETAFNQARLTGDQAEAALNAAQAEYENAISTEGLLKKQFADCFPLAPSSGVVVDKFIESGELIIQGKALIKIAKLDMVWVKIYVPGADLTKISLGGKAAIDPEDGSGKLFEATITWISEQAEFTPKNVQTKEARADLVYAIKLTIPNPEGILKIGQPVMAKLR